MLIGKKDWAKPETELDYWEMIELLGIEIACMEHDHPPYKIRYPEVKISQNITEARQTLEKLFAELREKFGVIHPKNSPESESDKTFPPAPEGKIYYWDWDYKMKSEYFSANYNNFICSTCPFSEGVEKMIKFGFTNPCNFHQLMTYYFSAPHICVLVSGEIWSREELYQRIFSKAGKDILESFKAKEKELSV